jgi:beta-N-acetylhexosaminidase
VTAGVPSSGTGRPLFDARLLADCYSVLLPVVSDLEMQPWLERLLGAGTRSVLLGESREEYVARDMSEARKGAETGQHIRTFVDDLNRHGQGGVLVAVDQEPWGIRRLHGLVPSYPDPSDLLRLPTVHFRDVSQQVARAAKEFGISLFLAPVVDVLEVENPWLEGRTLQAPAAHATLGPIAAAFVSGTQRGGVATVVKHFPGFPCVPVDPAVDPDARVPAGRWSEQNLLPFEAAVRAGAAGVMIGPAIVEDVDPAEPASTSATTVELLRRKVGFGGLIVSDDLDAPATMLGRTLTETMFASLDAGADLLLVAGGDHLEESVQAIFDRARTDDEFSRRVHAAAGRVRETASNFAIPGAVARP